MYFLQIIINFLQFRGLRGRASEQGFSIVFQFLLNDVLFAGLSTCQLYVTAISLKYFLVSPVVLRFLDVLPHSERFHKIRALR